MDYPLADGGIGSPKDIMDFDSTEIGYGVFFSPASGQFGSDKPMDEVIRDGAYWEFTPDEAGHLHVLLSHPPRDAGRIRGSEVN